MTTKLRIWWHIRNLGGRSCDNAIKALLAIGAPCFASLIAALQDERRAGNIRKNAARVLGELGNSHAVPALITVLEDRDCWEPIRVSAAWALARLGDPRAVEPLIRALWATGRGGLTTQTALHHEAASALGKLHDNRAVEPLMDCLEKARGYQDPDLYRYAAAALGELGDSRAVEPLIRVAVIQENGLTRRSAAEALGKLGQAKWRELIKGDGKDYERLATLGDSTIVALLLETLKNNSPYLRRHAATALCDLGYDQRSLPAIQAAGKLDPEIADIKDLWMDRMCYGDEYAEARKRAKTWWSSSAGSRSREHGYATCDEPDCGTLIYPGEGCLDRNSLTRLAGADQSDMLCETHSAHLKKQRS